MADTKQDILALGENLIRTKGYNAFSYQDIAAQLGVKNAAIHYHFPKKSDLAIQIIRNTHLRVEEIKSMKGRTTALDMLHSFIDIYAKSHRDNLVCLIGALAAEFYSLDESVQAELRKVALEIKAMLVTILKWGKENGEFYFAEQPEVKSVLLITNLLAVVQLERITGKDEFTVVQKNIIKNLTTPIH